MTACRLCGVPSGLFGPTKVDKRTGMCRKCTEQVRAVLITDIRNGHLPTCPSSIRLSSDEICHLETPATYEKVTARRKSFISGRFVATSAKLHFLAQVGTYSISWNRVLRVLLVRNFKGQLYLELDRQAGTGFYTVPDPELTILIFDTLTQMTKRQVLMPKGHSRQIPQHIRTAVWQRDGGCCVECGGRQNLEFDHIIPLSKGGANTVNNLQLLCRSCNARKSNKI